MTRRRVRVVGPPGTGKTTRLAGQVAAAAAKYGAENVLVSSFTKAAAREVAGRLDLPPERVGTLHAHAYRALGSPTIAETRAKDWNEHVNGAPDWSLRGTSDSLDDVVGADRAEGNGDKLLSAISVLRARRVPRDQWVNPDVVAFDRRWTAWKRETGYLDFTDLLECCIDYVDVAPGNPMVLFGDEAQDWSRIEWELVRKWGDAAEAGCMVVGDPAQTIFSFKGADPQEFLDFEVDEGDHWVLEDSYRVPRSVHAASVELLGRCDLDVRTTYRPRGEEGSVRRLADNEATYRQPEMILEEIAQSDHTEMILASCSFLLEDVIAKLRSAGIPFHNPYRTKNGAWNPLRGGSERVIDFLRPLRPDLFGDLSDSAFAEQRLWTWAELGRWIECVRSDGIVRRGAKVEVEARSKADRKRAPVDREIVTRDELRRVFEDQAFADLKAELVGPRPWRWLESRVLQGKSKVFEYPMAICERSGAGALLREPRVVVGTIHSVKGAEADRVWLFPDLSPSAARAYGREPVEDQSALGEREGHDVVVRAFYVGMTRARQDLVLCGAGSMRAIEW